MRTIVDHIPLTLAAIVFFATVCPETARADESQYLLVKMPSQVLSKFWGEPVTRSSRTFFCPTPIIRTLRDATR